MDLILVHAPYVLHSEQARVFSLFFFNEAVLLLKSNLCFWFCFVLNFALHNLTWDKPMGFIFLRAKDFTAYFCVFKQTR